jgi:MCP family monocarboxylic acid transporter-like MFS transporter 13/MCP family monocarboxylic acid transporter-like MFS transporter 12
MLYKFFPSDLEKKEAEQEEVIVPPDGGWGWFSVVGCALMHTFLIGTERMFGLIYLELIDKFNQSAAMTAWVGSLTTALRMGLGKLNRSAALSAWVGSLTTALRMGLGKLNRSAALTAFGLEVLLLGPR